MTKNKYRISGKYWTTSIYLLLVKMSLYFHLTIIIFATFPQICKNKLRVKFKYFIFYPSRITYKLKALLTRTIVIRLRTGYYDIPGQNSDLSKLTSSSELSGYRFWTGWCKHNQLCKLRSFFSHIGAQLKVILTIFTIQTSFSDKISGS